MAVAEDYVRGETLDVILDLLDEETLDGLFSDDITTAVEELTSSENKSGEFNCTNCKIKYKTTDGLTRHIMKNMMASLQKQLNKWMCPRS